MAQVRKYAQGDPIDRYTGTFTMNGRTLTGQLAIDRLANAYWDAPMNERAMFDVAQRAIIDGHHVTYNSDNTISVVDKNGNDVLNKYTNTKAKVDDSGLKKFGDAMFNNESHLFKKSGRYMAYTDMSDPTPVKAEEPTKPSLRRGDGSLFTYKSKPVNGIREYIINSPLNFTREGVIKEIRTYLDNPDKRGDYSTSDWTGGSLDILTRAYDSLDEKGKLKFWDDLWKEIKSGKPITDIAIQQYLDLINYDYLGKPVSAGTKSGSGDPEPPALPKTFNGKKDILDENKIVISIGGDGRPVISGNKDYTEHNWYLGGIDWAEGTDYENGFIVDGKLYTKNEALTAKGILQRKLAPWMWTYGNYHSWDDWYNRANNSGFRFKGDRIWSGDDTYRGLYGERFSPYTHYSDLWSNYFIDKGDSNTYWNYIDLTSALSDPNGHRGLLSFIDPTRFDKMGIPIIQYLVATNGEDGKVQYSKVYEKLEDLLSDYGMSLAEGANFEFDAPTTLSKYHEIDGNRYALYKEIGTPNNLNAIWIDPAGNLYVGRKNSEGAPISPRLIKNEELLKQILEKPNDPTLTDTKHINQLWKRQGTRKTSADLYKTPVFGAPNMNPGSATKLQFGGTVGSARSRVDLGKSIEEVETNISNYHQLNGEDGGLSGADITKIAAAIGDLTGLVLAYTPAKVASAVSGVGASITGLIADIEKDGSDSSDWLNFGANLCLDALTALPLIGGFAKTVKAAKVVKGMGTLFTTLAIGYGGFQGIQLTKKLNSGEKLTSEDLQTIVAILGSAWAAGRGTVKTSQDAKLAEHLDATINTKAKEAMNQFLNESIKIKSKVEGADTEVSTTVKEIRDLMESKNVTTLEGAKKALTEKFGEIDEAGIAEIFDKASLVTEKGDLAFSREGWKKFWHKRGDTKVSMESPAETVGNGENSAAYYFLHPKARNATIHRGLPMLDRAAVNASVDAVTGRAKVEEVQPWQRAVARRTMESPSDFRLGANEEWGRAPGKGESLEDAVKAFRKDAWGRGISRSGRTITDKPASPTSETTSSSKPADTKPTNTKPASLAEEAAANAENASAGATNTSTAKEAERMATGPDLSASTPTVDKDARFTEIMDGIRKGTMDPDDALRELKSDPFYRDKCRDSKELEAGLLEEMYRKKHKNSGRSANSRNAYIATKRGEWKKLGVKLEDGGEIPRFQEGGELETLLQGLADEHANTKIDDYNVEEDKDFWRWHRAQSREDYRKLRKLAKETDPWTNGKAGGMWGKTLAYNLPNIVDTGAAIGDAIALHQDKQDKLNALNILKQRQFFTPREEEDPYYFGGIRNKYDKGRKRIRASKIATSDMGQYAAFEESRARNMADLDLAEGAEISQSIDKTNSENSQRRRRNNLNEMNTGNTKSQYLTGLESQEPLTNIEYRDKVMTQVVDRLSQQMRQSLRDSWNMMNDFNYREAMTKAGESFSRRIENSPIMSGLRNEWRQYSDPLIKENKSYMPFEEWVYSNPALTKRYMQASRYDGKYYDDIRLAQGRYAWGTSSGFMWPQYKKGGSIRSAQEQIAIDGARSALKSTEKFSNELMKLLAQLMKIK